MRPTLQAQRLIDAAMKTGLLRRTEFRVRTVTKRYGPGGRDREYGRAYLWMYVSAERAQQVADAIEGTPGIKVDREMFGIRLQWPHIWS